MTTSDRPSQAYVWYWLPGATDPVVAGRIEQLGDITFFLYGQSYLQRPDAVPVYLA